MAGSSSVVCLSSEEGTPLQPSDDDESELDVCLQADQLDVVTHLEGAVAAVANEGKQTEWAGQIDRSFYESALRADPFDVESSGDENGLGEPSLPLCASQQGRRVSRQSGVPKTSMTNWLSVAAALHSRRGSFGAREVRKRKVAAGRGLVGKDVEVSGSKGCAVDDKTSGTTNAKASIKRKRLVQGSKTESEKASKVVGDGGLKVEAASPVGKQTGLKRGTKRAAPPSFAFTADASRTSEVPAPPQVDISPVNELKSSNDKSALDGVEAFMTRAGRRDKAGSITKRVSLEEVARHVPVSYVPDVLPIQFADHLARVFVEEAKHWHHSKRWLFDKEIESHRVESGFRYDDAKGFSVRWEKTGFSDDLRHLRALIVASVQRCRAALRQVWRAKRGQVNDDQPPTKHEIAQEVVALASRGQRLDATSAEWLVKYAQDCAAKGWRWEPNYVVANFYADENDFLGAHSDPVQSIGPWSIVASLTFGAARQFRMKPVGTVRFNGEEGGHITSFSIRLPHNSLLICWEGFQEFWRHEVPKDAGLSSHHITGPGRLNFTFRKTMMDVAMRKPLCKCGRKAMLKPVLKETSKHKGRYFWSCTNPRVRKGEYQTCDFFQWDDERVEEVRKSKKSGAAATQVGAKLGTTTTYPKAGTTTTYPKSGITAMYPKASSCQHGRQGIGSSLNQNSQMQRPVPYTTNVFQPLPAFAVQGRLLPPIHSSPGLVPQVQAPLVCSTAHNAGLFAQNSSNVLLAEQHTANQLQSENWQNGLENPGFQPHLRIHSSNSALNQPETPAAGTSPQFQDGPGRTRAGGVVSQFHDVSRMGQESVRPQTIDRHPWPPQARPPCSGFTNSSASNCQNNPSGRECQALWPVSENRAAAQQHMAGLPFQRSYPAPNLRR